MNKKANTAIFIVIATILNIVLMLALFLLSFALIARFVDPESSMLPLWLGLAFIVSIGGSFLIYSMVVKMISKKFNMEDHLAPLWTSRKQKKRREE
ncbi:MAG: leader peptide processing enzyme [Sphaerochaetaceae bacterium]|nr:leader peptide processing enzyme [Sphaerochaetaceae bacterium]